jgi:hypothetical protein
MHMPLTPSPSGNVNPEEPTPDKFYTDVAAMEYLIDNEAEEVLEGYKSVPMKEDDDEEILEYMEEWNGVQ